MPFNFPLPPAQPTGQDPNQDKISQLLAALFDDSKLQQIAARAAATGFDPPHPDMVDQLSRASAKTFALPQAQGPAAIPLQPPTAPVVRPIAQAPPAVGTQQVEKAQTPPTEPEKSPLQKLIAELTGVGSVIKKPKENKPKIPQAPAGGVGQKLNLPIPTPESFGQGIVPQAPEAPIIQALLQLLQQGGFNA